MIKRPLRHDARQHNCKKTEMTDQKHTAFVVDGVKQLHQLVKDMAEKYKKDDHCSVDFLSFMLELEDFLTTLIIEQLILSTQNTFKPDHFFTIFSIIGKNLGVEIKVEEAVMQNGSLH